MSFFLLITFRQHKYIVYKQTFPKHYFIIFYSVFRLLFAYAKCSQKICKIAKISYHISVLKSIIYVYICILFSCTVIYSFIAKKSRSEPVILEIKSSLKKTVRNIFMRSEYIYTG